MFKRKKKKTGCETPTYSRFSIAPEPKLESKPNPNYVPPASVQKTGIQTPELRKYTPLPMPPVKPAKKENETVYGLKLYIPFEDLDAYIRNHIEDARKYPTFIPIKAEVNELDLGIEISLVSAIPNEFCDCRYKLNLSELSKENNKCKD